MNENEKNGSRVENELPRKRRVKKVKEAKRATFRRLRKATKGSEEEREMKKVMQELVGNTDSVIVTLED